MDLLPKCIILYISPLIYINFPPQITETENMMDRIVSGLSESSIKVRLAAVRYDTPFLLIVVCQKTKATIHKFGVSKMNLYHVLLKYILQHYCF